MYSYDNECGKGNRVNLIDITLSEYRNIVGDINSFIDGLYTDSFYFRAININSDVFIEFDFKKNKRISEITWKQDKVGSQGIWNIMASVDKNEWFILKNNVNLGITKDTIISINNSKQFRYLKFEGVSGSTSNLPWIEEIEFKIEDAFSAFVINENDHLYSIKPEFYSVVIKKYTPINQIDNTNIAVIIENFGVDIELFNKDISNDDEVFKPLDKFSNFKLIKIEI